MSERTKYYRFKFQDEHGGRGLSPPIAAEDRDAAFQKLVETHEERGLPYPAHIEETYVWAGSRIGGFHWLEIPYE